ncbi:MAG TPA: transglycosylase domain-containing protein [Streptosporangiaceae bacterium]|nr:transglycosylase domain-containing protein [Streptosporangiaceae bacterium]
MLSGEIFGKGRSVGRLISMSAVGGVLVAAIMVPAVGSIGVAVRNAANKFDSLSTSVLGHVPQRSVMLDSKGHVLADFYSVDESYYEKPGKSQAVAYSGIDRAPVTYKQISPNMINAIVAIEDSRYWQHGALDFRGTMRALVNDLEHKPVQGGSTIAQQYVKNVLILSAKNPQAAESATSETIGRKLHELRLAIEVEHKMNRAAILASYLNDAYFGYPIVGVEVAAETYFNTTAAKLDLADSALLAGMVENPSAYDPVTNPATSVQRRNTVLARMAQLGVISNATAAATEKQPIGLHLTQPQNGCTSNTAEWAGFFCDYVVQSILRDPALGKTPQDRAHLLATGGLTIRTTLNPTDQRAANRAVNYVLPSSGSDNPGRLADAEALIQPGTGRIRAIAEDRSYGTGRGQTTIDFAATTPYGGGEGVQTGSSSKLFTLTTALEQGVPFGFTQTVQYSETVSPYYNCNGGQLAPYQLSNASQGDRGTYSLYTGTTSSINTFYAQLEKKVGLCNVVTTASKLGLTWGNGTSLFKPYLGQPPADNITSFTLGSATVAPISMAAAYATMAARGKYCAPIALESIVTDTGKSLAVPSAGCHQAIPQSVADAVNYVLQGVLTAPGATADNRGIGRPAAAKTGTAGSAHTSPPSAAFGGYTPTLAGYVWVGGPTKTVYMAGYPYGCYRDNQTGFGCPTMFGDAAPGATWQMTFEHAALGPPLPFVAPDPNSPLFSQGNGQSVKQPPSPKQGGGGNQGGGHHGHCPKFFPVCPGG